MIDDFYNVSALSLKVRILFVYEVKQTIHRAFQLYIVRRVYYYEIIRENKEQPEMIFLFIFEYRHLFI